MPRVIPLEVRQRAVACYQAGEGSVVQVASLFGIGEATLGRWLRRLREDGTLETRQVGGHREPLISDDDLAVVKRLVDENNDAFIYELVDRFEEEVGVHVSTSVMSRAVARAGITRKKRRSTRQNASPSA